MKSNMNGTNNGNRLKNVIEPAPSSSFNRNPSLNNSGIAEPSFNSPQQRRFSEAKRMQQQQQQQQQQLQKQQLQQQQLQQQNQIQLGRYGGGQQYTDQKYSNVRKDGSLAEPRGEGLSAYKQNTIRNIVSRGREGIFFDEGSGASSGANSNAATAGSVEPPGEEYPDFDGSDKRANGSNRVQRRHEPRRRHRQQPSPMPLVETSQSASSTVAVSMALPKLTVGTVGLQMSNLSVSQKALGQNGVNRGRYLNQYQPNQPQQQQQAQVLPSVRPQSQYHNSIAQSDHIAAVQQTPQSLVLKDSLAIYHEDHAPNAAVTSIKGLKPGNPNWRNQDNFFVVENVDGRSDMHFYCVLDGHGEHGHHVSRRARENFPQHIKSSNYDLKRAFYNMQNELCSCEYDVRCSGATCVLAILNGNRLSVSNCGDSRAVLGRKNPNGSVSAFPLSTDHKPDQPEERKRILACGGHVGCRHVLVHGVGRGGPVSMPVGPCRVWYQNRGETLGLAMSRSLGDSVVHRCGVSAEPETFEHTVGPLDEFLIIATDGVWDVLDNNLACQIVSAAISAAAVASNSPSGDSNWPLEAANNIAAGTLSPLFFVFLFFFHFRSLFTLSYHFSLFFYSL